MEIVKYPERIAHHFLATDGTRMEALYIRYPQPNGRWTYYKLPRSERKCQCRGEVQHDLSEMRPGEAGS